MTEFTLRPIGYVRSSRNEMLDDDWDAEKVHIELDANEVTPDSTLGLGEFSHIEVIFLFDRVEEEAVCRGARHPRNRPDWPLTGILAHRAKDRPNRIGLTVCRLIAVDGLRIDVSGLDAIWWHIGNSTSSRCLARKVQNSTTGSNCLMGVGDP